MNAEDLFLKKYGNKITASESWVIRFAEEYADQETERLKAELEAKDKEINKHLDISFALQSELNKINSKHVTEITMRNKRINDLEYKLTELKERHNNAIKTVIALSNESNGCNHNFIQNDVYWKSCTHCGLKMPMQY